jgi:hypothetical protein
MKQLRPITRPCILLVILTAFAFFPRHSAGAELLKAPGNLPKVGQGVVPRPLSPMIAGIQQKDCVKQGGAVTVLGSGFGASQGSQRTVLGGKGFAVPLAVATWSDTSIQATVPVDARIVAGESYAIGIQDSRGQWLGNSDRKVSICALPVPAMGPGKLPPAGAVTAGPRSGKTPPPAGSVVAPQSPQAVARKRISATRIFMTGIGNEGGKRIAIRPSGGSDALPVSAASGVPGGGKGASDPGSPGSDRTYSASPAGGTGLASAPPPPGGRDPAGPRLVAAKRISTTTIFMTGTRR